jgi:hypothetical protein
MRTRSAVAVAVLLSTASAASAAEPVSRVAVPTCPGRGYVLYSYPAIGRCPCDHDGCFQPGRYYSCDDAYEKAFWRRWRRAHFHGGSMLDGVPCRCLVPPGRFVSLPLLTAEPKPEAAPAPGGARPAPPSEPDDDARESSGERSAGGTGLAPPARRDVNF